MTCENPKPVNRTSAGLRDAIFDELEALRSGESNPTRANAVAKLASSVVETVRMEIDVQKHVRSYSPSGGAVEDTPLGGSLKLSA